MKRIAISEVAYGRLRCFMKMVGVDDYSEAINLLIDFYVKSAGVDCFGKKVID